jgi:hypothetical protein
MGLLESPVLGRKYLVGNSVFHGKYLVGKSGAWPKIFGCKYDKPMENIWFEIRKILDISGIINLWGWTGAGLRPFAHLYILRQFIQFALIMVLDYATIHIPSVRLYRF